MDDNRGSFMIFGGLIVALGLLIYFAGGIGNAALNNASIGTNGLAHWLDRQGFDTSRVQRRSGLRENYVSLRILPLYDTDLRNENVFPTGTVEEYRRQTSQSDISLYTAETKIKRVPTLVVLPKWRTGVLDLDLFDEQLLIPLDDVHRPMQQLSTPKLSLVRPDMHILETSDGIALYRPQLFSLGSVRGACRPRLSTPEGILIAECKAFDDRPHFILSDPDVLNNHGLGLGENASVVVEAIRELTKSDGTIFIDTTTEFVLSTATGDEIEPDPRTIDDLSRFLTYPFTLIYLGAGITFLILLWRGLIRFGPPKRTDDGRVKASKTTSIEAKSYLLRLAGEDHALLDEYINEKMLTLARDVMGKQTAIDQPAFLKRLSKIAPENAGILNNLINDMGQIGPETTAAELNRLTEKFEDTYRSIRDELGHVSRRR